MRRSEKNDGKEQYLLSSRKFVRTSFPQHDSLSLIDLLSEYLSSLCMRESGSLSGDISCRILWRKIIDDVLRAVRRRRYIWTSKTLRPEFTSHRAFAILELRSSVGKNTILYASGNVALLLSDQEWSDLVISPRPRSLTSIISSRELKKKKRNCNFNRKTNVRYYPYSL